jgi:Uma2 family endonuclease
MAPLPVELESWLEQRRARGQDRFDEVWEGEYHVAPAPHPRHGLLEPRLFSVLSPLAARAGLWASGACNIGDPDDYRVPDQAYFRDEPTTVWIANAAIVVEIVSPGDESRNKFGFYHLVGVEEVLIVDPEIKSVEWFRRGDEGFELTDGSAILGITSDQLGREIDWPT